jgi:hypothetical protein
MEENISNISNLIELEGLNQEEFDSLILDVEYLSLFKSNEGYTRILTPEQLDIINNL